MVFCSVFKVYTSYSGRRFTSDMKIAKRMGYISAVPHYNSLFNYLKTKEMPLLLKKLRNKSALALNLVETDFAVDSTGFSTSQFARWFNIRFGKSQDIRMWLKVHVMSGVKTNIVTAAEVTDGTASDIKQFKYLVADTAKDFQVKEISADKAYSCRENLKQIKDIGAMPYIPFKTTSKPTSRGVPFWNKMWHYYNLHREEFLQHYHKRSNVESTMHMIKTKFGGSLRSKTRNAQVSELLAKVLCHNICVVIQEMHELGFMPNS
jgi:transposase